MTKPDFCWTTTTVKMSVHQRDQHLVPTVAMGSRKRAYNLWSGMSSRIHREVSQLIPSFSLGETVPTSIDPELEWEGELKIFYSSRTHSQLTQFVNEVRRVHLPSASWSDVVGESSSAKEEDRSVIKHLPLASRKNLCINPAVAKLGNAPAINERCLELQQRETPTDRKCPYVPNKENDTLVTEFRDHTLATIRDIEDLGRLGKTIGICPYYAARATIKPSEVCE